MYKKVFHKDYIELIIVIVLVLLVRAIVVEPFRVPSASMKPTLMIGDFIFANKFIYNIKFPFIEKYISVAEPQRGDVIVFYHDKTRYVKRLIGMPLDCIIYKNKFLYINSNLIKQKKKFCVYSKNDKNSCFVVEYLTSKKEYDIKIKTDYRYSLNDVFIKKDIFNDSYFVLGDNRDNSSDSRLFGVVDRFKIRGKALVIWMSFDLWKIDVRWDRLLKVII